MKITRDVITDLLPIYLAGEASPDTQALIEAFFKEDPEFEKLVASHEIPITQTSFALPKETEMQTLEETKRLLWQRSLYLGLAIFFSLLPFSIGGNSREGVHWLWNEMPVIPVISGLIAILTWILYAHTKRKLNGSDL